MQLLEQYESIIHAYCEDRENFIKNYSVEYESDLLNALIFSLKLNVDNYQKIMERVEVDLINLDSIEYLLFLEGRIRFLANTKTKEVFRKKNSPIVTEFIDLCNRALSIFPYAFVASIGLALSAEMQKEYKKAVQILTNIYDYGFKSRITLDSIIYNTMEGREWKVTNKYVKFVQPGLNNFLTKAFIVFYRYTILTFCLGFICFLISLQQYWYFSVIALVFLSLIILFAFFRMKNRSMLMFYVFFNIIFLFPSFVGRLLLLLGFH
jgi:hypothetical protein